MEEEAGAELGMLELEELVVLGAVELEETVELIMILLELQTLGAVEEAQVSQVVLQVEQALMEVQVFLL